MSVNDIYYLQLNMFAVRSFRMLFVDFRLVAYHLKTNRFVHIAVLMNTLSEYV